jgi:hypothetical protein
MTEKYDGPERYTMAGFWIFLAVIAGGLAVAYEINKPRIAINIGAKAPLLYRALARGIRDQ